MLESAVAAPSTELFGLLMHPTVAKMAGVLAFSLAKNHAFHDGNKRAAAAATETFLQGCGLSLGNRHDWVTEFEKLAASETTRDEFTALIIDAIGGDVDVEND